MGFKKDGRVTAIDTFIVEASGPYRRQGDHATTANLGSLFFQPPNMRFRGISVATNTPPGVSQRAPGGLQASVWFEPLVLKRREARHRLGRDAQIERARRTGLVRSRAAEHAARTAAQQADQLLREGVHRQGLRDVWLGSAQGQQRQADRQQGPRHGMGTALHRRIDRRRRSLYPASRRQARDSPGRREPRHALDVRHRARDCRSLRLPVGPIEVVWGNTSKGLPWSSIQAGSQTTYAHTRANYATGMDFKKKLTEIAAKISAAARRATTRTIAA